MAPVFPVYVMIAAWAACLIMGLTHHPRPAQAPLAILCGAICWLAFLLYDPGPWVCPGAFGYPLFCVGLAALGRSLRGLVRGRPNDKDGNDEGGNASLRRERPADRQVSVTDLP